MPSNAYKTFNKNVKQVDLILQAYDELMNHKKGKKNMDHLTRAALLFLCSSWEVYIEQVTCEAADKIVTNINEIKKLPRRVKKTIAKQVRDAKNENETINFIDDWKNYYLNMISIKTRALNTPKEKQIRDLLQNYLGIDEAYVTSSVLTITGIDDIVTTRGAIAHNVFAEKYLKRKQVVIYYDTIKMAVREIDTMLYDFIPTVVDKGKKPWNNTY